MRLTHACEQFLGHRQAARRADTTVERYRNVLVKWLAWRAAAGLDDMIMAVTATEFREYLTYLLAERIPHCDNPRRPAAATAGLSPASVASARNILRAFWNYAAGEDLLSDEQRRFFRRGRIPAPEIDEDDRLYWTEEIVQALLRACEGRSSELVARDRAIILMLYEGGMRLRELCDLTDDQVNWLRRQARITGKGRKKRWVYWTERTADALACYRALRRGDSGGPVFRGASWRNDGGPVTVDGVRAHLKRLARRVGIDLPRQAPIHSARHGFVHAMIDGGVQLSEIAEMVGHSDIRTTLRYAREHDNEKLRERHNQAWRTVRNEAERPPARWLRKVKDDS